MLIHQSPKGFNTPSPQRTRVPQPRTGGSFYFNAKQLRTLEDVICKSGDEIPRDIKVLVRTPLNGVKQAVQQSLEHNCHSNAVLSLLSELSMNEYKLAKPQHTKFTILEEAEPLSHKLRLMPLVHNGKHKLPFLQQEYSGLVARNPQHPNITGSVFTQTIRRNTGTPLNPSIEPQEKDTFQLDERIHQYLELKHLEQGLDYAYTVNPFQF
jgi:hypothetical protein